jgi:hypothetical protein
MPSVSCKRAESSSRPIGEILTMVLTNQNVRSSQGFAACLRNTLLLQRKRDTRPRT